MDFESLKFDPEEEKKRKHLEQPVATDYDQFNAILLDAKNQFFGMRHLRTSEDEESITNFKENKYLHFLDYIKTVNKSLNEELLNNSHIQNTIKQYDELIDRAKKAETGREFAEIADDMDRLFSRAELRFFNYIDTPDKFWDTFLYFKNQFVKLEWDRDAFKEGKMDFEKLLQENKTRSYKTFAELLADENKTLGKRFENEEKYTQPVIVFDDLVERAKNFSTEEELAQIIKEINEFLKKQ